MLDEKWEYTQYTTNSAFLNGNNYKNGMIHALTVIARHELEEKKYWQVSDKKKRESIRKEVYETLKIWCFKEEADNMITLFGHIKETEKQDNFNTFIDNLNDEKHLLSPDIYAPVYNINKASFLRIIADAISLGPLSARRISCNKKLFEDLYIGRITHIGDEKDTPCVKVICNTKEKSLTTSKRTVSQTNKLFQIISIYMSVCDPTGAYGEPVYFTKMEIDHLDLGNKSYLYKYRKSLLYCDRINSRASKKGKRNKAWIISKDFIDHYEIKLEPFVEKKKEFTKGDRCYIYESNGEIEFPSLSEKDFEDIRNRIIQKKLDEEKEKKELRKEKQQQKKESQKQQENKKTQKEKRKKKTQKKKSQK
ncbi:MAG: hypothetical protein K5659_04175 [Lachnospiraceae bacterium]|nr:hypothetical protein [Lachnospiraceae bacterium]